MEIQSNRSQADLTNHLIKQDYSGEAGRRTSVTGVFGASEWWKFIGDWGLDSEGQGQEQNLHSESLTSDSLSEGISFTAGELSPGKILASPRFNRLRRSKARFHVQFRLFGNQPVFA